MAVEFPRDKWYVYVSWYCQGEFGMPLDRGILKSTTLAKLTKLKQKFQQPSKGIDLLRNTRTSCKVYGRRWITINASKLQCSQDASTLKWFMENDRTYDFLTGLSVEFDAVRVQSLGKEDLPSLSEIISIIGGTKERHAWDSNGRWFCS